MTTIWSHLVYHGPFRSSTLRSRTINVFSPNLFQFVLPVMKYVQVQDCTHNKICFFYVFKKANRLEITPVKIWNVINFKIILHQDKELWIVFVEIYFYMYMYITGRIQWKRISPLESKLFIGLGHNHRILCYSSLMIRHEVNHCITAVFIILIEINDW